jgi:sigma-54 specific flagellar transcriptional regulator A
MSNILIISSDITRANNLSNILTFLGEPCTSVLFSFAIEKLRDQNDIKAILIDASTPELACDISEKFPYQPFVLVGDFFTFEPQTNIVGSISEPLTYAELTQMLHRCQEYKRSQPNTKTSGHNQTRVFRRLGGQRSYFR